MVFAAVILTLLLAGFNGANDDAKGVATLAGAGVTRYRTAVFWGVCATLAGSLLSLGFASRMTKLFSAGIVSAPPSLAFAIAVVLGALTWVGLATLFRLPVSTTHAVVGALLGAGVQLAPGAVHWQVLFGGVAVPLLASVGISFGLSAALKVARRPAAECTCIDVTSVAAELAAAGRAVAFASSSPNLPVVNLVRSTEAACRAHPARGSRLAITMTRAHWLTSGTTSFARGLNDTPKIVAIGAFALPMTGGDPGWLLLGVAAAMAAGA